MSDNKLMWAVLVHLGNNMWNEEGNRTGRENNPEATASPILRFDRKLYDDYLPYLREKGADTLIIDIGEALVYESHPELAVEGSWSKEKMQKELTDLRSMGFEVIPKLNFSAGHDVWLKDYAYMLSTNLYRNVCSDLIKEVCEVFKPKYFHLGMDEENWAIQKNYDYVVVRQRDVWWRDFYNLVDSVEKANAHPMIWSDRIWEHPEDYPAKMPKSVIQCNWYYGIDLDDPKSESRENRVRAFETLDRYGYDQMPTGSNWSHRENMKEIVRYCSEHVSDEHLLGFMQTPWYPFVESRREHLFESADCLKEAKELLIK